MNAGPWWDAELRRPGGPTPARRRSRRCAGSCGSADDAGLHDSGRRDRIDEISDCEAEVTAIHTDGTVNVWVKALGEWNVHASRLRSNR